MCRRGHGFRARLLIAAENRATAIPTRFQHDSATIDGMVLDVPNKEGAFIVETSTFQSGTSLATLADMNDMIFEGLVDESEVGKLRQGMELVLNVGALEGKPSQRCWNISLRKASLTRARSNSPFVPR